MKIFCNNHKDRGVSPLMVYSGINKKFGTRQYVCARCAAIREFGMGRIISSDSAYGFIRGWNENVFFHVSNLSHKFIPFQGMHVSYELSFLVDSRVQAVNLKPVYENTKPDNYRIDSVEQALSSYANAYGLSIDIKPFAEDVLNGRKYVKEVGVHLRNPNTRQELLTCYFPVNFNFDKMLWASLGQEINVEAVPVYTGEITPEQRFKNIWRKFSESARDDYYLIGNGDFRLRVHRSLAKEGVVDKFPAENGVDYGYIRRNRRVYFRREWAGLNEIKEGEVISFVPIISPKGYQARAIEKK